MALGSNYLFQLLAVDLAVAELLDEVQPGLRFLVVGIERLGFFEEPPGGIELILIEGPSSLGEQVGEGHIVHVGRHRQGAVGRHHRRAVLLLAPLSEHALEEEILDVRLGHREAGLDGDRLARDLARHAVFEAIGLLGAEEDQRRHVSTQRRQLRRHHVGGALRKLELFRVEDRGGERLGETVGHVFELRGAVQADHLAAGAVDQAVDVDRVRLIAEGHGEEGRLDLDHVRTEAGAVIAVEWTGEALAVAQEDNDPLMSFKDFERAERLRQPLLEADGPRGELLGQRLESRSEVRNREEPLVRQTVRLSVQGPDGHAVALAELLRQQFGDLDGRGQMAARLAGRGVDQYEDIERPWGSLLEFRLDLERTERLARGTLVEQQGLVAEAAEVRIRVREGFAHQVRFPSTAIEGIFFRLLGVAPDLGTAEEGCQGDNRSHGENATSYAETCDHCPNPLWRMGTAEPCVGVVETVRHNVEF